MSDLTPEQRAYDILNRVAIPGWGDDITAALAAAIRAHGEVEYQRGQREMRERCMKVLDREYTYGGVTMAIAALDIKER